MDNRLTELEQLLQVTDKMQFKQLPQLLCGILALLASFTLLLLPETLDKPLPVTVDEAEELHQRYNIRLVESSYSSFILKYLNKTHKNTKFYWFIHVLFLFRD